ncbi:MAG: hypothetical protein K5648_02910 [Erysipelotrichaceae bacterium]|nr:hypothetical protein [Erysipelotrichaceae bacterium]
MKTVRAFLQTHPMFTTFLSAAVNLGYGIFLLFLAYFNASYWQLTLGIFFLILGIMRFLALDRAKTKPVKTVRLSGLTMLFLAVTVAGMMYLTIHETRNPSRDLIIAVGQAAYCFLLTGIVVFNLLGARRKNDPQIDLIRNVSFVSAIDSMLSLERMMLGTFGDAKDLFTLWMETCSGMAVFLLIVFIGMKMLIYKTKN